MKNILAIFILTLLCLILCSPSALAADKVSLGYWHPNTNPETYQPNWTALTHVANIDWNINSTGYFVAKNSDTLRHSKIMFDNAKEHGVKTLISASATRSVSDNILAYHQDTLVNSITDTIKQTEAEGVILDFEYPSSTNSYTGTSNTPLFEEFMRKLYKKVKSINPEYTVAFCTPPYFEGVTTTFQNSNLSNYIDFVFIMGYDYHYNGPTGANSPFYNDSTRYGLRYSIAEQSKVYGKDKVVYGVPFYGYEYIATSNSPGASISSVVGEFYLKDVDKRIQAYGRQWDSDSNTPYYYYLNDSSGTNKQVVLNNCDSLGSTTYDYHVNRTVEKGAYKCVAISDSSVFMLLRNPSRWNLSSANYVNADIKAPIGKTIVFRLFSNANSDYVNYRVAANGNWQHITIPFKTLYKYGNFDPNNIYDIRIDMTGATIGDIYYVDNITTSTEVDTYYQGWYDDAESLTLKCQYIKDLDVRGVGFFALGEENSNIWDVLSQQKENQTSQLPIANFVGASTSGNLPLTVQFNDRSTNEPTSWQWNFGDGTVNSTLQNPSHTYETSGVYTVTLTASNAAGGSTISKSKYITVSSLIYPTANFTANVTSGVRPLVVKFTDSSQNTTGWYWDFDNDGKNDSTIQNPTYTYNSADVYSVKLTAVNANGSSTKLNNNYIIVANGTKQVLNNCDNLGSTSYDYHVTRTVDTSNKVEGIGSYKCISTSNSSVYMLLRNSSRWDISSANYVSADIKAPAVKSMVLRLFSSQDSNYINYRFTANGSWQKIEVPFKELAPIGNFNSSSVYDIRVDMVGAVVGDTYYVDNITTDADVNINNSKFATANSSTETSTILPEVNFSSNVTSGTAPLNVSFTDTSTSSPISWNWNFGDGAANTTCQNPTHTYSTAGNYTVTLTATNSAGSSTTAKSSYIKVTASTTNATSKPVVSFWGSRTSGTAPLTIGFTDASTNTPTAWKWSFGDGTYSTLQKPRHTYSKAGTYSVTLTASNEAGSTTKTRTNYIKVA